MKVLGIETSCDETAVTILEGEGDFTSARFRILGNALYSQAALHAPYGGVYPTLAKREHQGNLAPLTIQALEEAKMIAKAADTSAAERAADALAKIPDAAFRDAVKDFVSIQAKPDIDLIAVTKGPGLEPALWTGINFAEALGAAWNVPVAGIDHLEGHIVSALLKKESEKTFSLADASFPLLSLLISGGHTEFVLSKAPLSYEPIGGTKDDAVGEAFDKVARLLGLPSPGGPHTAAFAARSRERESGSDIEFPRPLAHDDTCDFSFSGLKTAVLYKLRAMDKISEEDKEQIAQAFEDAARDIIVIKTKRALKATGAKSFAVGGGVSANAEIREGLTKLVKDEFPETTLMFPDASLTGDNAVMIAAAGYLRHAAGRSVMAPLTAHGSQKLA